MATDSFGVCIEMEKVQEGDISESETQTERDTPIDSPIDESPDESPASTGITILIAGRSGSGKSTLASNLLRKKTEMTMSPDSVTQQTQLYKVMKNGVEITILDTKGLEPGKEEKARQMRGLAHAKEANLIMYSLPVGPGSKFNDGNNREIMKAIQGTYGKNVWSHCVLVLTFSDLARNQFCSRKDGGIEVYKDYITKFVARFQEELNNLENTNVIVKSPFTSPELLSSSRELLSLDKSEDTNTTIVAIPTGFDLQEKDETLPLKWQDMLFQELLKKCSHDQIASLLQYQYGREEVKAILKKAATTGAKAGIIAGMPGGPLVAAVGGAIGGTVGVAVGGVTGAVMLAVELGAKRNICELFKVIN